LALPDSLIFKNQWYGNQRRPPLADPAHDREGRTSPGPKGRHNDIRIQDDRVHEERAASLLRLRLAGLNHTKCLPGLGHMGFEDFLPGLDPGSVMLSVIRRLLWPRRIETSSMGTPFFNSSTANVCRNRCG